MVPPGLVRLGSRVSLRRYLAQIWERRDYILTVPRSEVRSKHLDTFLGNVWHLLAPLMLLGVYYLIFGVIIGTRRGLGSLFLPFLATGLFMWQYTSRSVTSGAKSITTNIGLIRSLQFPRAILPVTTVISQALIYFPTVAIMIVVLLTSGIRPTWSWLLLVPVFGLQTIMNLGFAFITARITDIIRDFENILPFMLRILFYVSGILYSVDDNVKYKSYRIFFTLNPVYALVTVARDGVFGYPVRPALWLSLFLWAFGSFIVGFVFFRAGETEYGRG